MQKPNHRRSEVTRCPWEPNYATYSVIFNFLCVVGLGSTHLPLLCLALCVALFAPEFTSLTSLSALWRIITGCPRLWPRVRGCDGHVWSPLSALGWSVSVSTDRDVFARRVFLTQLKGAKAGSLDFTLHIVDLNRPLVPVSSRNSES